MRLEGEAVDRVERKARLLEIRRKESQKVFEQHKRARIADGQRIQEAQDKFKQSLKQARKALTLQGDEGRIQISRKLARGRKLLGESDKLKRKLNIENRSFQVLKGREQAAEKRMLILSRKQEFIEASVHESKIKKAFAEISREDEEVLEILSGRESAKDFTTLVTKREESDSYDPRDVLKPSEREQDFSFSERVERQQYKSSSRLLDEQNQPALVPWHAGHERGEQRSQPEGQEGQPATEASTEEYASFDEMYSHLTDLRWSSNSKNTSVSFHYKGEEKDGVRVFIEHRVESGIQVILTTDAGFSLARLSKVLHLIRYQMKESEVPLASLKVNTRNLQEGV